ncbi:MAG: TetR/AcrR family transcriptional regulator [Actinomycetia bacterium]|nr:TetR/AcrR family transcriptional regulator [Actinomycetes bacterium]
MGRPAKFDADSLLDSALAVVARRGRAATVAEVAAQAGARVGSVYYRFPTREILMAALWVRSIHRFHAALLAAVNQPDDPRQALAAGAVLIVRYCREHPDEARAMTLYRHPELLRRLQDADPELRDCPDQLRSDLLTLNNEVYAVLTDLTVRAFGSDQALGYVRVAVLQTAYGLVRPYLADLPEPMPPWLEDLVAAMVPAALAQLPACTGPR